MQEEQSRTANVKVLLLKQTKGTMTYKNTFQIGIKAEDLEDRVKPERDGIPVEQGIPWRSQEDIDLQQKYTGVPMPAPDMSEVAEEEDPEPAPRVQCAADTKKGNPCKGWAVGTGLFCMVHDF